MATWKDNVLFLKRKLEKESTEEKVINTLCKLEKIPITIEILQDTGIGKCVNSFKKQEGEIGEKAREIISKWKLMVSKENPTPSSSKSKASRSASNSKNTRNSLPYREQENGSQTSHLGVGGSAYAAESGEENGEYSPRTNSALPFQKYGKSTESKFGSRYSPFKKDPEIEHTDSYNPTSTKDDYRSFVQNYQESDEELQAPTSHTYPPIENHQKKKVSNHHHSLKRDLEETSHTTHHKKHKSDKKEGSTESSSKLETHVGTSKHKSKSKQERKSFPETIKSKKKTENREAFDNSTASFEACLGLNDNVVTLKSKPKAKSVVAVQPHISVPRPSQPSSSSSSKSHTKRHSESSDSLNRVDKVKISKSKSNYSQEIHIPSELQKNDLQPLDQVDVLSTLPEIQPDYKPLRLIRLQDSPPRQRKNMTNEDAIAYTSSRREKTAVYSGRRNQYLSEVPTLYDSCIKTLIENIDALGHTGGVPYDFLKPVLIKCTPVQLYAFEDFNNYLLEETDELWLIHSHRDFKGKQPDENETWRDLYLRLYDERERKFKSLTANISASMAKATPVRKVQLAYVDSTVKPPREVARKQAKNGTALPTDFVMKLGPPGKGTPRPIIGAMNSAAAAASSREPMMIKRPKVAPLMQKTLKLMKQRFRR